MKTETLKDIQVWGSPACSWCKKATDLLDTYRFEYDYFNALEAPEQFNSLFPNATTVPQIIFRGNAVGGYEGLCSAFEDQNIFMGSSSF